MSVGITRAVESWRSQGLRLRPGLSRDEVHLAFAPLHIRAPNSIEVLYTACNGMADGEQDAQWFELWPVERVVREALSKPSLPYIAFGEGFLRAFRFWARFDVEEVPVFVDGNVGEPPRRVARCLDEAFSLLVSAPQMIGLP